MATGMRHIHALDPLDGGPLYIVVKHLEERAKVASTGTKSIYKINHTKHIFVLYM